MTFKSVFLAFAPDADPEKHNCVVKTAMYELFVRITKNQEEAIEVIKKLVEEENIHSIILCPGFTHQNIAEISQVVGKNVGIAVARTDGPSGKIVREVMKKEGWF